MFSSGDRFDCAEASRDGAEKENVRGWMIRFLCTHQCLRAPGGLSFQTSTWKMFGAASPRIVWSLLGIALCFNWRAARWCVPSVMSVRRFLRITLYLAFAGKCALKFQQPVYETAYTKLFCTKVPSYELRVLLLYLKVNNNINTMVTTPCLIYGNNSRFGNTCNNESCTPRFSCTKCMYDSSPFLYLSHLCGSVGSSSHFSPARAVWCDDPVGSNFTRARDSPPKIPSACTRGCPKHSV